MKNIHVISTKNKNHYFYNFNLQRLFLIHPILYAILSNPDGLNNEFDNTEIEYYQKKYKYLKKHHVLDSQKKETRFFRLDSDIIKRNLMNLPQITFEITDKCNLSCTYCAYGEMYNNFEYRSDKNLDEEKAIRLIDTLVKLWKSDENISIQKPVSIAFYGGEPLLNMEFVYRIVEYTEKLHNCNRFFTFSMTTNAMLLNKYMDYLVTKKFKLLISLDGDANGNMNRISKKGTQIYDKIIDNIELLREKYPDYFDKYVDFNSVLHDKNSLESLYSFFHKKYNKKPRISVINPSGIRADKVEKFRRMYKSLNEEITHSEYYSSIVKWLDVRAPGYLDFAYFVYSCASSVFYDYDQLCRDDDYLEKVISPTGTCLPFGKKMYVTVNAKLLSCERIGHEFVLGCIEDNMDIDYDRIVLLYNNMFDNISKKCKCCYQNDLCTLCVFQSNNECHMFMDEAIFANKCIRDVERLEENPSEYDKIMNKLIIT